MKKLWIMYLLMFVGMVLGGCHESTVGYLITKDASYNPDSIVIRLTPAYERGRKYCIYNFCRKGSVG